MPTLNDGLMQWSFEYLNNQFDYLLFCLERTIKAAVQIDLSDTLPPSYLFTVFGF